MDLGKNHGPGAPRLFDNGAQEYFSKYGGGVEHLAKIASKNHKNSVANPYSQFRDGWTVDEVLAAPKITKNLTKFMCSPTSVSSLIRSCATAQPAILRKVLRVALSFLKILFILMHWRTKPLRSWLKPLQLTE